MLCDNNAASQCTYLYYSLKVRTLLVKKKYTLLSVVEEASFGIYYHVNASLTDRSDAYTYPVTVNWPVNHLVKVNILHISCNLTSYRIGGKIISTLICQLWVFMRRTLLIFFAITMYLNVIIPNGCL